LHMKAADPCKILIAITKLHGLIST
jgi:hypothetical protein